jgi:hypothetical protein
MGGKESKEGKGSIDCNPFLNNDGGKEESKLSCAWSCLLGGGDAGRRKTPEGGPACLERTAQKLERGHAMVVGHVTGPRERLATARALAAMRLAQMLQAKLEKTLASEDRACDIGGDAHSGSMEDNSGVGVEACYLASAIDVGKNSCHGNACQNTDKTTIGDISCVGFSSCRASPGEDLLSKTSHASVIRLVLKSPIISRSEQARALTKILRVFFMMWAHVKEFSLM